MGRWLLTTVALLWALPVHAGTGTRVPAAVEILRPGAAAWEVVPTPRALGLMLDAAEVSDGVVAITWRSMDAESARGERACDLLTLATRAWGKATLVMPTTPALEEFPPQDLTHQVLDLHNGKGLLVDTSVTPPVLTLFPGNKVLPWPGGLTQHMEAGAWADGTLLLLGEEKGARSAHRLPAGGARWEALAVPSDLSAGRVITGAGGKAVLERPGTLELWDTAAWKVLPPLHEPRVQSEVVLARDGSVVVVGGVLLEERTDPEGMAGLVRNVVGAVLVVTFWVLVYRAIPPKRRPLAAAVLLGVVLVLLALAAWLLPKLAWH